jgi:Na+-transporting methylmalonyl-CoA/oxaloacetate decarboxylase gamma subunit
MKKSTFLTLLLFASTVLYAQQTSSGMGQITKLTFHDGIYLLVGGVLVIFSVLSFFLLRADSKQKKAQEAVELKLPSKAEIASPLPVIEHFSFEEEELFESDLSSVA